jgi:hypothetical protein
MIDLTLVKLFSLAFQGIWSFTKETCKLKVTENTKIIHHFMLFNVDEMY